MNYRIVFCSYVKSVYLQQIESAAPNYLMEEYRAVAPPQKEDDLKDEKCSVLLQIAPYHTDQPGLRIHYKYKNEVSFETPEIIYNLNCKFPLKI